MSKEDKKKKDGAVRLDELKAQHRKAIELAEKTSPDLTKLQKVKIDNSTCIYIGLDKDPVLAKKRFIEKLNARPLDIRYKNYDTRESY
jgi:hypothetical protein